MSKKDTQTQTLLEPQHALRAYLDALLCEIDVDEELVSANVADEVDSKIAAAERPIELDSEDLDNKPPESTSPGLPEWAQHEFQSLSFKVAGLMLAAPLEKLNGIVELNEDLSELPGYSPWVLGILNNRGQNVQVIDLAQVIMPDRRPDQSVSSADNPVKYIVLINGGNFGIAADSLSQVLTLSAGDVRWRGTNSKRPWLAGTVIEQMCAILDIDRLTESLEAGIKASA